MKNLTSTIERILTTDIPGTPRLQLHKAARDINALLNTEIPGTISTEKLLKAIEAAITADIPGTPQLGLARAGRVQYRRMRGSVKSLSVRARQVIEALDKHKGVGTARDLQAWLKVNRNVIAGALHELRQAQMIRSEPLPQ
jgi:hypothetical protein